ncbi:bifunctional 5,10-methylenetetrahydrofolate dehydrogenase/5,10-methenyltetrahydrofolate cyclohydrolase [Candidatus Uabimicrobium sp. HlEnr_7]|uniref:bifunctional 5,10-methylenetetrahydrofolate dehydrogenase/5,10-methenyltetrahydrofolate cyclohydrolase n=1 Tax=Candidatus Uabimicrobium helgolandensis TaxID=3095367 RepID=UPI003557B30C
MEGNKGMVAKQLEGKFLSANIMHQVKKDISCFPSAPRLVSLLIGSDSGARSYAKIQESACKTVGISFELIQLPASTSEEEAIEYIEKLNNDPCVTGILIFVPVPKHINKNHLIASISHLKDVEGISPTNMGKLFYGSTSIVPCTPKAVMLLIKSIGYNLVGKEVVVISRSPIIGQPLLLMLLESANASPTPVCCHIATKNLEFHTKRADVVIVAAGKANLIHGHMLKEGAVVIDVGINLVENIQDGRKVRSIVGDVHYSSAMEVASWLTPVPGGVGLVTTAVLLQNVLLLAKQHFTRLGRVDTL